MVVPELVCNRESKLEEKGGLEIQDFLRQKESVRQIKSLQRVRAESESWEIELVHAGIVCVCVFCVLCFV